MNKVGRGSMSGVRKLPLTITVTLFNNFSNMHKRYNAILVGVVKQYVVSYKAAIV